MMPRGSSFVAEAARAWPPANPTSRSDSGSARRPAAAGRTASKRFEEFPTLKQKDWGRHFWARGYFCATAGEMTEAMIKEYLEHHFEPEPAKDFKVEP